MKRMSLMLALLLVGVQAHAGAVFIAESKVGGKIVLTDDACSNGRQGKFAYLTDPVNNMGDNGCWLYDKDTHNALVLWSDETQVRTYPIEKFNLTPYGESQVTKYSGRNAM
jgi:hypothetical protein